MSLHQPIRPDWTCATCSAPWPCLTRKRQLIGHYRDTYVSLVVHLTRFFVEASQDMPGLPAGVLHRRFLGWPAEMPEHWWYEKAAIDAEQIESPSLAPAA